MPEAFPSASDKECRIGGYILLSTIGKGSFAKVMLARHIVTGTEVAVKIVNRQGYSLGFREFHCLQHLNHPNITRLFEVIATDDHYFLFMEHLSGGELCDYLEVYGARTEEEARTLFRQLVSALHYCHQKGFVHRDLKPENILLDADHNIKLADFGFSKEFCDNKLSTFCGTVSYMAPEILRNQPYDGPKVDIWSLGVILYKMVTGKLPFEGDNFGDVKRQVLRGHFFLPYFISEECQNLLKKIITLDPAQRLSLDAIMKDPWVNRDQKEGVKLYHEPPCRDIDPQITENMRHLGYDQEEVRESVAHKTYNNIMGTYLILHSTKTKIKGHTVRVRPCSFPDQRHSTTPELQAAEQKTNRLTRPPTSVAARVAIPATSMAPRVTIPTTRVSARVAIPATSMAQKVTISTTSVVHRVAIPITGMEVKLAVPSTSTQEDVAICTTSGQMEPAVPSATTEPEVAIPTTSGQMEPAVPSATTEPEVAIPSTSGQMQPAVPSATTEPEVAIPSTSGQMEPAVPSATTEPEVAIPSTSGQMEPAVPSATTEPEVAIPSTSGQMEPAVPSATTEPEVAIPSTSGQMQPAVPSATTEPEVAIPSTSGQMQPAVPSATTEPEVAIPSTSGQMQPAVPSATTEPEVAIPSTTGQMQPAVPSATTEPEVAITSTSGQMQPAVPSATTEPEVAITSTSLEPRVDVSTTSGKVKVDTKQESVKSRTLSCPESQAAILSRAFHHSSLGSFTTASSALHDGSSGSLTTPGSRKSSIRGTNSTSNTSGTNSTRGTRGTSSTSSRSQGPSSHHSEGRQQGPRRALQFFLKVFCCGSSPSMDKNHTKKKKVHPRLSFKIWRVKIGPQ